MTVNTLGAVPLFDGENPRTFTAKAIADISGGDFVVTSGTSANTISSGANSYTASDIEVKPMTSPHLVNGLALQNASSGTYVAVATRGSFIMRASSAISGGQAVIPFSGTVNGVLGVGLDTTGSIVPVGRSITGAASGTALYTLVGLNM